MLLKEDRSYYITQYFAAIFVNFTTLVSSISMGWSSPVITLLSNDTLTPLPSVRIRDEEISWIGSSFCFGGWFTTLSYNFVSDALGRKKAIQLIGVPLLVSWLLIAVGDNVYYIYGARFFSGFAGGALHVVIPVFVTEISDVKIRGRLGSILPVFGNIGILFGYLLGGFVDYNFSAYIPLSIIVIFYVGLHFIHDPPSYLASKGKKIEAEASLRYYKGIKEVESTSKTLPIELENFLVTSDNHRKETNKLTAADFCSKYAVKSIALGFFLVIVMSINGTFVLINYAESVFGDTRSNILSPSNCSIVMGIVLLFGSMIAISLIDRFGRKVLLFVSALLSGISILVMGAFKYLEFTEVDVNHVNWIPVVSLSCLIFFAGIGISSVPFAVIPEILPEKIKGTITSGCMFCLWVFGFVQLKLFPFAKTAFGLHNCTLDDFFEKTDKNLFLC